MGVSAVATSLREQLRADGVEDSKEYKTFQKVQKEMQVNQANAKAEFVRKLKDGLDKWATALGEKIDRLSVAQILSQETETRARASLEALREASDVSENEPEAGKLKKYAIAVRNAGRSIQEAGLGKTQRAAEQGLAKSTTRTAAIGMAFGIGFAFVAAEGGLSKAEAAERELEHSGGASHEEIVRQASEAQSDPELIALSEQLKTKQIAFDRVDSEYKETADAYEAEREKSLTWREQGKIALAEGYEKRGDEIRQRLNALSNERARLRADITMLEIDLKTSKDLKQNRMELKKLGHTLESSTQEPSLKEGVNTGTMEAATQAPVESLEEVSSRVSELKADHDRLLEEYNNTELDTPEEKAAEKALEQFQENVKSSESSAVAEQFSRVLEEEAKALRAALLEKPSFYDVMEQKVTEQEDLLKSAKGLGEDVGNVDKASNTESDASESNTVEVTKFDAQVVVEALSRIDEQVPEGMDPLKVKEKVLDTMARKNRVSLGYANQIAKASRVIEAVNETLENGTEEEKRVAKYKLQMARDRKQRYVSGLENHMQQMNAFEEQVKPYFGNDDNLFHANNPRSAVKEILKNVSGIENILRFGE